MSRIINAIRSKFQQVQPLPPGMYHYQAPPESEFPYRLHLRIEPDGTGVLIINASTVLHLNQTATEYAYHIVKRTDPEAVIRQIAARYNVAKKQVLKDYNEISEKITTLLELPDLDPVTYLGLERSVPYSAKLSAPYRLDCAITYKLPEGESPTAAPIKNVSQELSTQEWINILEKAWLAGIPHIIFTGGEPTLREDLPELIKAVEENGQVSGLLTNGLRLTNKKYLDTLLQTGLDHMMIVLQPENEQSWQAIHKVASEDIYLVVHLTITPENYTNASAWLERLAEMDVNGISLSGTSRNLADQLQELTDKVAQLLLDLVWDLPVPYSSLNPVALETEEDNLPQGAGKAWLYVEPDGDVLPYQGSDRILGNLIKQPWQEIWQQVQLHSSPE